MTGQPEKRGHTDPKRGHKVKFWVNQFDLAIRQMERQMLKTQPFDFFKIQDLRSFDLDTQHTLTTRKFKRHISRKTLLPCANSIQTISRVGAAD
jgi:hypothetical protein